MAAYACGALTQTTISSASSRTFLRSTLPVPSSGMASTLYRFSRFGIHSLGSVESHSWDQSVSRDGGLAVERHEPLALRFVRHAGHDARRIVENPAMPPRS